MKFGRHLIRRVFTKRQLALSHIFLPNRLRRILLRFQLPWSVFLCLLTYRLFVLRAQRKAQNFQPTSTPNEMTENLLCQERSISWITIEQTILALRNETIWLGFPWPLSTAPAQSFVHDPSPGHQPKYVKTTNRIVENWQRSIWTSK